MNEVIITKSEIGADKWPVTVDEVVIQVDDISAMYVKIGNQRYNLNGIARKGKPFHKIWLDNPDILGTKKSIGFIFDMCRERSLL